MRGWWEGAEEPQQAHAPMHPTSTTQLPSTKWRGLKLLPCAAPCASDETFRQMVRQGVLLTQHSTAQHSAGAGRSRPLLRHLPA